MKLTKRLSAALAGLVSAFFIGAIASAADPSTYSAADFAKVPKIDTHVHLAGDLPKFMERAAADDFRMLAINVNYGDFPALDVQQRDAIRLMRTYPERIAWAATFDAHDSESPGWLARTQKHLDEAFAQGAVGVKVWKDIGMSWRDKDGRVVLIDDARFAPIFSNLEKRGIVLLAHQAEPRNAWLPLDQMTIEGDRSYFREHPQYHMANHPEWPGYDELLAARDRMLAQHPKLEFVGVHLASIEWDVDRLSAWMRAHPQANVDLAARLVHLELQSVKARDKVRAFFVEFQDRILYGTDLSRGHGQSDAAFAEDAHAAWLADWAFLAGGGPLKSNDFEGEFSGLALPRAVIDKVYGANARRLFPTAWRGTAHAKD